MLSNGVEMRHTLYSIEQVLRWAEEELSVRASDVRRCT